MHEYVIRLLYWKKIIHFVSERRRRNHIPSFQQRLVSNPLGLISLPIAVLSSARWYNTQSTSCLWSWEAATEKEKHAEGHAYVVCFKCMCPGARHCPSTKKKRFWSDAMKLSQRKLQTYRRRYVVASSLPSWPHGEPFPEQHLMMVLINAVYGTAWCRNPIEADILH